MHQIGFCEKLSPIMHVCCEHEPHENVKTQILRIVRFQNCVDIECFDLVPICTMQYEATK